MLPLQHACDIQGKPFPYGDERVEVTLTLLGSSDCPLNAKVIDNKNGTYRASFIPRSKGEHQLSIRIDSHHIKGSPFSMYMRQAKDYTKGFSSQKSLSASSAVFDVPMVRSSTCFPSLLKTSILLLSYTRGDGEGQMSHPSAIAIRGSTLYVADSSNHRIQKLTTSGKFLIKFGDTQVFKAGKDKLLNNPYSICLDIGLCV